MLLKTNEAAKELGVTKPTLESWRCRGGGPVFVKYGRAVRYRTEDLEAFIEQSLCNNTTDKECRCG
jgi:excisionase family DNA binding protein